MSNPAAIPRVKSFMAPVWVMAGIAIIRILITVSFWFTQHELQLRYNNGINKSGLFLGIAFICIAIAEAIVYWQIRRKKYNRRRARAHLLLMLFSMVILPLVFILVIPLTRHYLDSDRYVQLVRFFGTIRFYVFWICFIGASILFINIAQNAFSLPDEAIEDRIDAIGMD